MKKIKVRIEGTTPLLLHRFSDEAATKVTKGRATSSRAGNNGTPLEQAEKCLYVNENGKPIIPQPNLFRCIMDAGKFFKNGKSKVTTIKSSIIPAVLELDETYYFIHHKEPWVVDTRPVVIPSTGGRILRHRPCFHDWFLDFQLVLDDEEMSDKFLRDIVDAAGSKIGLGDFRPACKGPFGKFKVVLWKVVG
jgi:hypothetical protein